MPVVLQDGENTYVYGLDLIPATDGSGEQMYFTYDGLGSVTDLTDENGEVVATYSYDVFGAIRSQTGSSENNWLFTGEQMDGDSGLQYLRARYYDPEIGRFLTRDPLRGSAGNPQTQNEYAYVLNNPCRFTDPTGTTAAESTTISCHAELDFEGIGRFPGKICLPLVGCANVEWFPADTLAQLDVDVDFTIGANGSITAEIMKADVDTPWLGGVIGDGWVTDGYVTVNSGDRVSVLGFVHRGFPFDISATLGLHFGVDESGRWGIEASLDTSGSPSRYSLGSSWKGSCKENP